MILHGQVKAKKVAFTMAILLAFIMIMQSDTCDSFAVTSEMPDGLALRNVPQAAHVVRAHGDEIV